MSLCVTNIKLAIENTCVCIFARIVAYKLGNPKSGVCGGGQPLRFSLLYVMMRI